MDFPVDFPMIFKSPRFSPWGPYLGAPGLGGDATLGADSLAPQLQLGSWGNLPGSYGKVWKILESHRISSKI